MRSQLIFQKLRCFLLKVRLWPLMEVLQALVQSASRTAWRSVLTVNRRMRLNSPSCCQPLCLYKLRVQPAESSKQTHQAQRTELSKSLRETAFFAARYFVHCSLQFSSEWWQELEAQPMMLIVNGIRTANCAENTGLHDWGECDTEGRKLCCGTEKTCTWRT